MLTNVMMDGVNFRINFYGDYDIESDDAGLFVGLVGISSYEGE